MSFGEHLKQVPHPINPEEEKQRELKAMKERIQHVLSSEEIQSRVRSDFEYTFGQLGLNPDQSQRLCQQVFEQLTSEENLDQIEQDILHQFEGITVPHGEDEANLVSVLHEKLRDRAEIIFHQLAPHLQNEQGKKSIDYGAGDGQVTQMLKDRLGLDIEGVDVREYRAPGVTIPIMLFNGKSVDVPDGTYEVAVMTNVAHHEKNNEQILEEFSRIVTRKIVVIETVPVGETEEDIAEDRERTFMNDYLYNRLFHNADIPVPGTYETPQGWVSRFEQHGWHCTHSEDLGEDQPTIKDTHHLLVFER